MQRNISSEYVDHHVSPLFLVSVGTVFQTGLDLWQNWCVCMTVTVVRSTLLLLITGCITVHFLVQVVRATSGVMGGVRNGRTRTCTGDPCYIPRLGTVPVPPAARERLVRQFAHPGGRPRRHVPMSSILVVTKR